MVTSYIDMRQYMLHFPYVKEPCPWIWECLCVWNGKSVHKRLLSKKVCCWCKAQWRMRFIWDIPVDYSGSSKADGMKTGWLVEKVILYSVTQTKAFSVTGVQGVFISPVIISRWGIAVTFCHLDPLIPQHGGLLIPELLCVTCRYTPDLQCVTQMGKNEIFLPLPLICQADSWQTCCYLSHCWTAAATDYHVFLMAARRQHSHIWKDSCGFI